MPSTVNVNSLSLVHASSVGISTAFPDVCKTPAPPAPSPVPIPYPNVAMSSDTDGTSTVKADGASCMVKSSTFRMSSGDEAGVALGVVSNKIKGKAHFAMYSFDVKIEGSNACRLSDPMLQNGGSDNASGPALLQAMIPGFVFEDPGQEKACERAQKAETDKKENQNAAEVSWRGSGIFPDRHRNAILKVVKSMRLKVIFRSTKTDCKEWIAAKYQPKPHDILKGTTITESNLGPTRAWLEEFKRKRDEAGARGPWGIPAFDRANGLLYHNYTDAQPQGILGGASASTFVGLVGSTASGDVGRPILANVKRGTFAKNWYIRKYVTGDYDVQDVVLDEDGTCKRLFQKGAAFAAFQREVNIKMGWDGIQHGPQAQWVAQRGKEDAFQDFSHPKELVNWLKGDDVKNIPMQQLAEGRPAKAFIDDKLTVVTPRGAAPLESHEEVKDFLVCCGCKNPSKQRRKEL